MNKQLAELFGPELAARVEVYVDTIGRYRRITPEEAVRTLVAEAIKGWETACDIHNPAK